MILLRRLAVTLVFPLVLPLAASAEVSCPAGEITLDSALVRAVRNGRDRDQLASPKNTFVIPEGVVLDPMTEPILYAVEVERQPLYTVEVPGGTLVANRAGTKLRTRRRGLEHAPSLSLARRRGGFRMDTRFVGLDLAALDLGHPPSRVKQVLRIGDDCFSAILACAVKRTTLLCRPERSALLRGSVRGTGGDRLAGAMVTAYDDARFESVTVFAQKDGRYVFPPLRPGRYRLRARLVGYEDRVRVGVVVVAGKVRRVDFALAPTADSNLLLPATHFMALLLDKWPSPTIRGDFTLSCGNCHQIGSWRFRRDKIDAEWEEVVSRMMRYLPPFFPETRNRMRGAILETFGPGRTIPPLPLPPPPSGEVLRAVIYEYGLGDETFRPGCHDLELGTDGVVYADAGVRWIDPRTGRRGTFPIIGGAHSIERAPDGNMWITQNEEETLAKLDVRTGGFTYYPLPKIGEDQGSYPHTLRFDSRGRIWFTLTKSNHVGVFDPATEEFAYHRLPPADAAETGLPIPVAYGCDTGPDDTVWFSQLFGQRIGRFVPATGTIRVWKPPFYGPRRLHADADGIVWVPGYSSGVLGRFDPAIERWKVYDLPTGLPGPPGFGSSETPYALNANRLKGEVWVTGSNSDTLIRFDPAAERFTAFPLPTLNSFTREIEFDPDNNVWTCTANAPPGPGEEGRGRFVKLELPPKTAECGNGRRESGEECDDGNATECDGCTSRCTRVTGCGDGAVCGSEACDDGNEDACDGCSASCQLEVGLRCGDGIVNTACGEDCDPPVPGGCSAQCTPSGGCGNGTVEPGEACDDGNQDDCDGCTSRCTPPAGCGDGVVCGTEACDDGNDDACDGCSSACETEVGHQCGDGIVSAACVEECDPPSAAAPECNYVCRLGPAAPLGTRRLSFGGNLYSSPLGTGTPLGTPVGSLDLVAGAPGPDGVASVSVGGPVYFRTPLLGGSFGHLCVRIASCTGIVDCAGGTAVDVQVVQDSAGPGKQQNPEVTTTGLGNDGGPGAVLLTCMQAIVQTPPDRQDCPAESYPPDEPIVHTTGRTEGSYLNGDPHIGTGRLAVSGENFVCARWSTENGPGQLTAIFLMEDDPLAGDTANATVLDD